MGLGNLSSSFGMAHRKSRSLNKTNWKVKFHSIIGRKEFRSSFKIESSGRSNWISIWFPDCTEWRGQTQKTGYTKVLIWKERYLKILN